MNCHICDRFKITDDPKMPFLKDVICPSQVESVFQEHLPFFSNKAQLVQIKVIRYKPQRRCLIEYSFQGENSFTLIGKVRAKGTDIKSYSLQKKLWHHGFDAHSHDGISVPEPIGIIPQWQMWLQKKVPGELATFCLTTDRGVAVSQKIAHIAHKLHQSNIPFHRRHTMTDELSILHQKLPEVIKYYPHWKTRIQSLLEKCNILGENTPENPLCGIHRDFYPDQILVDNDRFYLLDLDLYCEGDPALDIGNFIGHMSEYSLRALGHLDALQNREATLLEEFIKLTGDKSIQGITAYTTLTLVRHIYLSTQFPERHPYTEALLNFCEEQLESMV